jgi:hypothetical protein
MIHVVMMKCLTGFPVLIHIEILWRSRSPKNWGVRVRSFVYRLHSTGNHFHHDIWMPSHVTWLNLIISSWCRVTCNGHFITYWPEAQLAVGAEGTRELYVVLYWLSPGLEVDCMRVRAILEARFPDVPRLDSTNSSSNLRRLIERELLQN